MKILLVEDNRSIVSGLEYAFDQKDFEVETCCTARKAEEAIKRANFDVVVLDISLPDGNGIELFENHIVKTGIPVIFLTAKDDDETIIKGLSLGAEDYITKPFSTNVLIARIEKVVNRRRSNAIIRVKDIEFDIDKMVVFRDSKKLEMSSLELKILHLLFLNVDKVVRRDVIINKIWDWTGNDVEDNTVTVYMKRIREKVGADVIATIKGLGYRVDRDEK